MPVAGSRRRRRRWQRGCGQFLVGDGGRPHSGEAEVGDDIDAELRLVVLLDHVDQMLDGVLPLGKFPAHAAEVVADVLRMTLANTAINGGFD